MAKDENVIDAEVVGEEEVKEEAKENGFKKFWKKTKQSVNDAVLESKIESSFNKNNVKFGIYAKDETFGKTVFGTLNDLKLNVFGEIETTRGSIVIDDKTNDAYKIIGEEASTCTATVDGVEYERPATLITLSRDVKEVKVIKAGKRYFLDEE